MKTASRILGSALFYEGWEVQDAPRYGAERRGAPIAAYVRADHEPIYERGAIVVPDLVVVADEGLLALPGVGVCEGVTSGTTLLVHGGRVAERASAVPSGARLLILPAVEGERGGGIGTRCAGAAAQLLGVVSRESLAMALAAELSAIGAERAEAGRDAALEAFDAIAEHSGCVRQGEVGRPEEVPDWIELAAVDPRLGAPIVLAAGNSGRNRTGLWRTLRPVVTAESCHRCWWVCSTFCPDGCISVDADDRPVIDYGHCKGCLICAQQCPHRAIRVVLEREHVEEAR